MAADPVALDDEWTVSAKPGEDGMVHIFLVLSRDEAAPSRVIVLAEPADAVTLAEQLMDAAEDAMHADRAGRR